MPKTKTEPRSGPYRAVIFDLDGTLLDTLEDIAGSVNAILERRGRPLFSVEGCKMLVGDGIDEMVRRAWAPDPVRDEDIHNVIVEFRDEYERRWRSHSRPYPGIPELLTGLAGRGIEMAVLSNKSHPFTERMTLDLLPDFRFAVIRGATPDIPLKPDPSPALMIAEALRVPPSEFVFLGDTKIDMRTARAAGMVPVGALWGFRGAVELLENGASRLLSSPLELLDYF
jgi:phosphoglycolate phosphatase